MHRKYIACLLLLTGITFFNCLLNGFVGDDEFLFVKNPYYHSWGNFPKIFTDDYIADQDDIFNDVAEGMNSGSVAYRPVLSTTFFLDYSLWGKNPLGYHLTNVLIHLVNTVLVYFIFFTLLKDPVKAFIAALIFSLHPLKSEAVASIGYRADSLAAMFVLASFLSYARSGESRRCGIAAHAFFFLALFSKESAVVLPGVVMAYDWLIRDRRLGQVVRDLSSRYLGFVLILVFYLFVYTMVFPNSSLGDAMPLKTEGLQRLLTIWFIFSHYVTVFVFPFLVKALPPLYAPPVADPGVMELISAALAVLLFGALIVKARHEKSLLFFLCWFLLSFIPVSNIIAIANPMAYRFMYLPSVGLSGAAALLLMRLRDKVAVFQIHRKIFPVLVAGLILLCMSATIFLNFGWRDNAMMALTMVRDFPDYPVGYMHAGIAFYDAGLIDEAEEMLLKGIEKGLNDPRAYYLLGVCNLDDPIVSREYFEKSIDIFPRFLYSYIALGRHYLLEGDPETASAYLYASLEIDPRWNAYGYLMQAHGMRHETEKLKAVFEESQRRIDPTRAKWLEQLYESIRKGEASLPTNLGI